MSSQRIFLAINLPPEIKGAIYDIQERLHNLMSRSRITWVDPEIAHITLHFLGKITDADLSDWQTAIREGQYPKQFVLRLSGLSGFPNLNQPRTIYLETINGTAVHELHKELEKIALIKSQAVANRKWQPHITLGRRRFQSERFDLKKIEIPELDFRVDRFELMASELTASGPIYTALESFPL